MAKFEIEAKIGANNAEFQKKLKESSREAREFAQNVRENTKQTKEVFGEIAGAAGVGKFASALSGGAIAAGLFGAAIVEAIKGGIEAYQKLEDAAFKYGQILKDPAKGQEFAKAIEEMPGHLGNQDEMNQAGVNLLEAYKAIGETDPLEKAKAMLLVLANVSAETGKSIATMAEQYRVFVSGGEDAEKNGAKLAKGIPVISSLIEQSKVGSDIDAGAARGQIAMIKYQLSQMPAGTKDSDELKGQMGDLEKQVEGWETYKKTGKKPETADILKHISPRELDRLLVGEYGPGGKSAGAADAKGSTLSGKEADVSKIVERLKTAFGEGYETQLKKILDELITELPSLTLSAKQLGDELGKLIAWIDAIRGDSPQEAGRKYGEKTQRAVLERQFGMRFDENGNPMAQTPLQRLGNERYEFGQAVQRSGYDQTQLFGSNTGGKDLQQQQLDAMRKIEENTAKQVDVQ